MDTLLASSQWQGATLSDRRGCELADTWLREINQAFSTHSTNPLLIGEEASLHQRLFDLIMERVRERKLPTEKSTHELIKQFVDESLTTWERHLIFGDRYDPRDNGFIGTPLWSHPLAKKLLFKLAEIAFQAPHSISIGQQTSIKKQLIEKIMSIVTDDDYIDDEETCLALANAIFIREVLRPLDSETAPLQKKHGFDRMPRQGVLKPAWGMLRRMNQEEINTALPIVSEASHPSIVFLPTYDRLSSVIKEFREIMAGFLKKQLVDPKVKHIFIPFGNHTHWQAVYIHKEDKTLKIHLFEPFGEARALANIKPEVLRLLEKTLTADEAQSYTLDIQAVRVPHPQTGGIACGYYVVAYAHYLMKQLGFTAAKHVSDESFDVDVAASFEKGQGAIEQSVIALHDNRYNKTARSRPVQTASPPSIRFPFFQSRPARAEPHLIPAKPVVQPRKQAKDKSDTMISATHVGRALHLTVKKASSKDPILLRGDIQAVHSEITRLTHLGCRYFNFGAKSKAESLRQAYRSYLNRLEACEVVSPSIIEDKTVKETVDSYRYFGFFYRLKAHFTGVEKKTASRTAIEMALSQKHLS